MLSNFPIPLTALLAIGLMTACSSACSSGGGSGGSDTPTQSSNSSTDYRSALIAVGVGVYSGKCASPVDGSAMSGSVTVAANGQVTAPNLSASLMPDSVTVTFARDFNTAGAATRADFIGFDSAAPSLNLSVGAREMANDNAVYATVTDNAGDLKGLLCDSSPQTTPLKAANATTFAMPYILTPATMLTCTQVGSTTSVRMSYEVTNLQVKFGSDIIGLTSGLEHEQVIVLGNTDGDDLNFTVRFSDGRAYAVARSNAGVIRGVTITPRASGPQYTCVP